MRHEVQWDSKANPISKTSICHSLISSNVRAQQNVAGPIMTACEDQFAETGMQVLMNSICDTVTKNQGRNNVVAVTYWELLVLCLPGLQVVALCLDLLGNGTSITASSVKVLCSLLQLCRCVSKGVLLGLGLNILQTPNTYGQLERTIALHTVTIVNHSCSRPVSNL